MEIESFFESCGACGSRTIHFVMDPPFVRRHCAGCGRDNSVTWGREYLPGYPLTPFTPYKGCPAIYLNHNDAGKPTSYRVGMPVPIPTPWNELSNFDRSQHFSAAALHE